jgi:hypothetical protein
MGPLHHTTWQVYTKYSGLENVPGEVASMSVGEWMTLAEDAKVVDDFLVDRSVRLAYVRAKQVRRGTSNTPWTR